MKINLNRRRLTPSQMWHFFGLADMRFCSQFGLKVPATNPNERITFREIFLQQIFDGKALLLWLDLSGSGLDLLDAKVAFDFQAALQHPADQHRQCPLSP